MLNVYLTPVAAPLPQALQETLSGPHEEARRGSVSAGRHAAGRPRTLSHGCRAAAVCQ